jgi:hypothetical protein
VDFYEARDIFVNIVQFSWPNCKITDCGLISEKQRGLSAKSAKLDRGLISKKHRGFFAKWRGISARDLFFQWISRGPGPRIRGPAGRAQSTVDQRLRGQRGGQGVAARSPELGLRPLWCTKAHRQGRDKERSAWRARLGPHRGSGGVEEAGRWRCRTGGGGAR